jgi:hypothetical protein
VRTLSCLLLGAVLACGGGAPPDQARSSSGQTDSSSRQTRASDLELKVNARSYAPSETVQLQLFNRSTSEVSYNLCTSRLEHRSSDGWMVMPDRRACTLELRTLAPGDSAATQRTLDSTVAAGEYRLVAVLDAGGQVREVASAAFTISARVSP